MAIYSVAAGGREAFALIVPRLESLRMLDITFPIAVKPMTPDDPDFADLVESGEQLIWVVDEDGNLILVPDEVNCSGLNQSLSRKSIGDQYINSARL